MYKLQYLHALSSLFIHIWSEKFVRVVMFRQLWVSRSSVIKLLNLSDSNLHRGLRITWFLDFVHCLVFWTEDFWKLNHFASFDRLKVLAQVGLIERAVLNHFSSGWTVWRYVQIGCDSRYQELFTVTRIWWIVSCSEY